MKFYSEVLDKLFDSEAEVEEAENAHAEKLVKQEENKKQISKEKKALSEEIDKADAELDKAYKYYEDSKQEVLLRKKNVDKECQDIMKEAKEYLKDAQTKKLELLEQFTNKFGSYSVSYTGDRAQKEMNRHLSWFDDLVNHFWWF